MLPIKASGSEVEQLESWVKATNTPQGVVKRTRIILLAHKGKSGKAIGQQLKVRQPTIRLWKARFLAGGPPALRKIALGRDRKPSLSRRKVAAVVRATIHAKPKGPTHWSCRSMARAKGLSFKSGPRIWKLHGLKPHLPRTFKISRDKRFVEKLTDIVEVYLNPPDKAVVLCVDGKSQIQALDRTQPGLPLKKGRGGTRTHDYVRHGTTTRFAALDVVEGKVIGQCLPRHRHQEFWKFLRTLDASYPKTLALHLILDNYGTHKHAKVRQWLDKHPRFKLHFTPTSASWTNLVERWFRELSDKAIRRGVLTSVADLEAAIEAFLTSHNQTSKPFVWTASVDRSCGLVTVGVPKKGRMSGASVVPPQS